MLKIDHKTLTDVHRRNFNDDLHNLTTPMRTKTVDLTQLNQVRPRMTNALRDALDEIFL